jgi:archaetidylinositol phosphate synthase
MVLNNKRDNIDPLLNFFAKHMVNINPDALSWLSLLFAFISGLFFYFSSPSFELNNFYLCLAVIFVFLNGFFDAIDGKIAKLTNKISKKGDFLDHAIDRYADVLIIGGLALSPWCRFNIIGFAAIVGVLLTSYMGTQAQAVGYNRNYSGLLGRADRLVLLMFAPIVQHFLLFFTGFELILDLSILEWILIYFAIVGNITALQRFSSTIKWFKKEF